ncbi:hypothetical protein HVX71_06460 [Escherichia coli]|nr:hypothetical protein [Escherichia coli]QMD36784.1 hypothetical protein HVZ42_06465 [Escherichia coli]QMK34821.1 hypothetical protein HVX74_06460 [Escherichia coli]QMK39474.1 hypothetical protein HVX73_06465 [Escherichia coli]QMK48362.1 hypothetical protein HVX71_06460 [Escherichia coli]
MNNRFYMMCLRETVGNNASFHCHNGNGYSSNIDRAHVYTLEGLLPDHPGTFLTPKGDFAMAKVAFQRLWESIYGEESWNANPWVWVIEFKRIQE